MTTISENKKTEIAIELNFDVLKEYLTSDTEPLDVAKVLDDIEKNYSQILLDNPDRIGHNFSSQTFELRRLRNIFLEIGGITVFKEVVS